MTADELMFLLLVVACIAALSRLATRLRRRRAAAKERRPHWISSNHAPADWEEDVTVASAGSARDEGRRRTARS
jgi:hypothetical protein